MAPLEVDPLALGERPGDRRARVHELLGEPAADGESEPSAGLISEAKAQRDATAASMRDPHLKKVYGDAIRVWNRMQEVRSAAGTIGGGRYSRVRPLPRLSLA